MFQGLHDMSLVPLPLGLPSKGCRENAKHHLSLADNQLCGSSFNASDQKGAMGKTG